MNSKPKCVYNSLKLMARLYLYNHAVFVQIHISINMNKNVELRQRFDSTLHVFYRFKKLKKFNVK